MKTFREVLDWHLGRYPLLQAADIYKLVHQSVFGPGHIIENEATARQALEQEFADLRKRCCMESIEPVEPLAPDSELVRVNLVTLRDVRDATVRLLPVLVATTREIEGSAAEMEKRLEQAVAWCCNTLSEQAGALADLIEENRDGFPPRHHSEVYSVAYRPAYRVVSARLWDDAAPDATGDGTCAHRPSGTSD
jgi:hypothetical protein